MRCVPSRLQLVSRLQSCAFSSNQGPALLKLETAVRNPSASPFATAHNLWSGVELPQSAHAVWDFFGQRPAQASQFNKAMCVVQFNIELIAQRFLTTVHRTALDGLGLGSLKADYAWNDECSLIVDVGGGTGSLLAGLLEAAPAAKGVLFDIPSVIEQARSSPHLAPFGI